MEVSNGRLLTVYYQKVGDDRKCSLLWSRWRLPKNDLPAASTPETTARERGQRVRFPYSRRTKGGIENTIIIHRAT